jgi:hypothetical protein
MFVQVPKQQNILRLPANFLTLENITDAGDLEFSVVYHINRSDIVQKNATICRISAVSRVVKARNVVYDNPWPRIDNTQVIKNILSLTPNARAAVKNQESFRVGLTKVDNTKVVNNETIPLFRANVPLGSITSLNRPKLQVKTVRELHLDNNIHPILQVNPPLPIENISLPPAKHVFQTHLVRFGTDPTHTYDFENETLEPKEAIHGLYGKSANRHVLNIDQSKQQLVQVFKQLTFVQQHPSTVSTVEYTEDTKVLTFSTEIHDEADVRAALVLPASKVKDERGNYYDIFLQFDLLANNVYTIQSHQEKVDLLKHLEVFYTPKLPPVATVGKFDTMTKGNIKVRQVDPTATSLRLYRKNFSYAVNEVDDYAFVNEYPLSISSGQTNIPVDVSARNTTVFRLVPVGPHETLGAEFYNVVVRPSHPAKKITYVSLTSRTVNVGINLEIREVPADVVAVQVLRRDDTLKETAYSIVGDDVTQVNPQDTEALYVVTDNNVKTGHVYEYTCGLVYKNGTVTRSGNAIVEFVPLVENLVDTRIENLEVSFDVNSLDVKFNINTTVVDTQLDTVKDLLQRQGIEQHYIDELTNERDKLGQLIAHQVNRVDETSGQRESFGTVTAQLFSDTQLRAVNSVSPLKTGHKYRYEVIALLRSPETLLEGFSKQSIDEATKKDYVFKPNKFLHPIALQLGNIANPDTVKLHYPKDQMTFGNVGNLTHVNVSFAEEITGIVDATVEDFDTQHLLIKWKVIGPPGNVDHFIIMKEHLGQRKIVGKSHANFEHQSFTFIYVRDTFDIGELFFAVQPVYNSYNIGSLVKTNGITLE